MSHLQSIITDLLFVELCTYSFQTYVHILPGSHTSLSFYIIWGCESLFFLDSFPFTLPRSWSLVHPRAFFIRSCPQDGSAKHKIKKTRSLLTSPRRASKVNLSSVEFKLTWPSPFYSLRVPLNPVNGAEPAAAVCLNDTSRAARGDGCKHKLPFKERGGRGVTGEGRRRWKLAAPTTHQKKKVRKKKAVTECLSSV